MKNRLKKYKAIKKELEILEVDIRNLRNNSSEIVTDSVKDYRTGFPRTITITGVGSPKLAEAYTKMANKRYALACERNYLEDFINKVKDSEVRTILRLQYIHGMTLDEIAEEMNYSRRTIANKLFQFWEDYKNS